MREMEQAGERSASSPIAYAFVLALVMWAAIVGIIVLAIG